MAYTNLEEGTKIRASVLNANFESLKDDLNAIGAEIQLDVSSTMSTYQSSTTSTVNTFTTAVSNCVTKTGPDTITGNKTFKGVTIVPNSTASGTAISNAESSYASPGYIKFGNGVMIQWGKYKNTSQSQKHTLPQAFKNTSYIVTRAHQGTSYEQKWAGGGVSVYSESKINITVGNDVGSGLNTFIIAIGRWN